MAWMYCDQCGREILDWKEAYRGCPACLKQLISDQQAIFCAINNIEMLEEEMEKLKEKVRRIDRETNGNG